jgi:hypothetical protein
MNKSSLEGGCLCGAGAVSGGRRVARQCGLQLSDLSQERIRPNVALPYVSDPTFQVLARHTSRL